MSKGESLFRTPFFHVGGLINLFAIAVAVEQLCNLGVGEVGDGLHPVLVLNILGNEQPLGPMVGAPVDQYRFP